MTKSNAETVIESLDTDLGSSSGDNISFHQANKAYYEDRDYNEAIKEFQAAIEYEILQPPASLDTEIIVKSIYWLGESYLKLNQRYRAFEEFRQLSEYCSQHHLGRSAQRRASSLSQQDVIPKKKHKPKGREKEAKQRTEAEHRKREHQLQIVRQVIVEREKEVKQRAERKQQEAAERSEKERQEKTRRAREAKQRAERKRREAARRREKERQKKVQHERKKQALLKNLREYLERDFLIADNFYQTQCTAHISLEEYEDEKNNVERRNKERQERIRHEKEKQTLLKKLRKYLEKGFLAADNFYQTQCTNYISTKEYETEKINYVQSWAEGLGLVYPPDLEQAAAIGAVEGNVQVVARAGSGKTATLVNRALFLQEHCGIAHDEMLLLAFNRKAAEEMRERLTEYLQDSIPHVMTFHALAYALVHPNEKILLDNPEGEQSLSRAVQRVIDQHRRDSHYNEIRTLMMEHFRADWELIFSGGYDLTPSEMLRYRRSLVQESLDGTYVKSSPEKVIANFLFEHDIEYKYERNFWWDGINYRPDFTIGDRSGVIIEYFGLEGTPITMQGQRKNATIGRINPTGNCLNFLPMIWQVVEEIIFIFY